MVKESEKTLERKFNKGIKALGGWAIKFLPFEVAGLPDRIALLPGGVVFFAEIKTTGEKASKIQNHQHKKLRGLGFEVYVIDNSHFLNQILLSYEDLQIM